MTSHQKTALATNAKTAKNRTAKQVARQSPKVETPKEADDPNTWWNFKRARGDNKYKLKGTQACRECGNIDKFILTMTSTGYVEIWCIPCLKKTPLEPQKSRKAQII